MYSVGLLEVHTQKKVAHTRGNNCNYIRKKENNYFFNEYALNSSKYPFLNCLAYSMKVLDKPSCRLMVKTEIMLCSQKRKLMIPTVQQGLR